MSILAHTPTGQAWYFYAKDEVPTIEVTHAPGRDVIRDTLYESPAFFSTSRTIARQWRVLLPPLVELQEIPLTAGRVEYVEFVTPAGVSWVMGLQDDGILYVELFTSGVPKNRRLVQTVMHKGTLLWVADNRTGIPRSSR